MGIMFCLEIFIFHSVRKQVKERVMVFKLESRFVNSLVGYVSFVSISDSKGRTWSL